ncbi:citramalate synthase [Propionibacterium australiense]|uniref:Citramalate synthase n=1 Tax=Propionibacterium australiense TaxID=119981 RepID=A0A383S6C5_9ACTN|nr:citramalate synthase [Propionibacterium australiense]RLP10613.1 citramalate synthase [Propionibacterium australiense]RLP12909.1 citramalate synthase [Propionibacterium australiense]SYZ32816.1 2-isopropylmalate synthase [Propionibacterium australiense]VEH91187.1 2-isopropylmalate synthase [Propionibacterium australiense]
MIPLRPDSLELYDTTLSASAQRAGVPLTLHDRIRVLERIDVIGVAFIEGGRPAASLRDKEFFARAARVPLRSASLVAIGSVRRPGTVAADDPQIAVLRDVGTRFVTVTATAHDLHVGQGLRASLDENLMMLSDTVRHLVAEGKQVIVDAEHYFDGFARNPAYALEVVRTAAEAGARTVVLCDTNGGMLPDWIADAVSATTSIGVDLGIRCENDSGCAVANSLAGLGAGAVHVQGAVNGYGARAGTTDVTTLIPDLQLKYGWPVVTAEQLRELTRTARVVGEITAQPVCPRQPYVGESAFANPAGPHAAAMRVNADLHQHVDPRSVGNDMRLLVSDLTGRANIQVAGAQLGLDLADRAVVSEVARAVHERETRGYAYEAADASFELLVRRMRGELVTPPFTVLGWRVMTGQQGEGPEATAPAEAVVRIIADGAHRSCTGAGTGPVKALGQALRRALDGVHPQVKDYELADYRVRLIRPGRGSDATVRVLIDTSCHGRTWTTVGVGENIVEASWEALTEAFVYGLVKGCGQDLET